MKFSKAMSAYLSEWHSDTTKSLNHDKQFLPKQLHIAIADKETIREALLNFFSAMGIESESDKILITKTLFRFYSCRRESTDSWSGATKDMNQIFKDWIVATTVIGDLIKWNNELAKSKGVIKLHKWMSHTVKQYKGYAQVKNNQPVSYYPNLIYQLVSDTRKLRPDVRAKTVFDKVDDLLAATYPSGLRKSRSIAALEVAFRQGKRRLTAQ